VSPRRDRVSAPGGGMRARSWFGRHASSVASSSAGMHSTSVSRLKKP
jgi:hypothetical protein